MKTETEIVKTEKTIYKCEYCDFISYSKGTVQNHEKQCKLKLMEDEYNIYAKSLQGRWFRMGYDIFLIMDKADRKAPVMCGNMPTLKTLGNKRFIVSTISVATMKEGLATGMVTEIPIEEALQTITDICNKLRSEDNGDTESTEHL